MQATYYVIHAGTQDIVLQKNALNPGLYWGQHMAAESLEKAAQSMKTGAFTRPTSALFNPHSIKNRISWTPRFPIKPNSNNSSSHIIFKPFVSAFDQRKLNSNVKRIFKHSRTKSCISENADPQTQKPITSNPISARQSRQATPRKKSNDVTMTTLTTASPTTTKSSEHVISHKGKTFETVLKELKIKPIESDPSCSLAAKLKGQLDIKPSVSEAIKDNGISPRIKQIYSSPKKAKVKKLNLSQKERKEWNGGFMPFPLSAKDDKNNHQFSNLALSTDLDSFNFELTARQPVSTAGRTQLETKKVIFFGKDFNESEQKSRKQRPASAVVGNNKITNAKGKSCSLKSLLSTDSKLAKAPSTANLDHIAEQLKLAESNLANENAIFTRPRFSRSFRDLREAKIRVNQLQDLT